MDAASHTGIDDIREIIEQVRYRPVSARYKVYIIDEVHMLSTAAFNGLLKTLEEPPEHVKFIFATTEIRKVPITVLSRCQRFDLRRISASDLVGLFTTISAKEGIDVEADALAMIARAAEGSARDGLSLLDQAIAHGGGSVQADTVRSMLGLADRARIVDLFEHVVKGDVAAALAEFNGQYEAGANPVVVLTDLADFTHLVTRLKYVPDSANDPSLSEIERTRGLEFSQNIAVTTLSRIWQMLLKGIPETENSSRTAGAAEMVLIRLAHAAHLPSPEDAARRLAEVGSDGGSNPRPATPSGNGNGNGAGASVAYQPAITSRASEPAMGDRAPEQAASNRASDAAVGNRSPETEWAQRQNGGPATMLRAVPDSPPPPMVDSRTETKPAEAPKPSVVLRSVSDIADLCSVKRDPKLKAMVRAYLRLVKLEPGRLDVALAPGAPGTLLNELTLKLKDWTGIHWIVSLSRDGGAPTEVEAETKAQAQRMVDASQDPDVAAILSQFPGAKIIDVRVRADPDDDAGDETIATPAVVESDEGDILPGDDIEF
jgi:DNA polymerase-3 subunit gamma/tau